MLSLRSPKRAVAHGDLGRHALAAGLDVDRQFPPAPRAFPRKPAKPGDDPGLRRAEIHGATVSAAPSRPPVAPRAAGARAGTGRKTARERPSQRLPGRRLGAGRGTRTPDPEITNHVLYQLSYAGPSWPGWVRARGPAGKGPARGRGRRLAGHDTAPILRIRRRPDRQAALARQAGRAVRVMKVTYHIGLHATDGDSAVSVLLRNAAGLRREGGVVARPDAFRPALRDVMVAHRGTPSDADTRRAVLARVSPDLPEPARILFSSESFLCLPARAVQGPHLYPQAAERAPWIRAVFPDAPVEFAFAMRNPATFLPAIHRRFAAEEGFGQFLARVAPERLSWLDMVTRLRDSVPDCALTIWADEDSALLWPDILQALSGTADPMALDGVHDFPGTLMQPDGLERMRTYLETHPPSGPAHRRKVVAAFLDRFAQPAAVEMEFDLPGWTAERIAHLTERYEADLAALARLDGVRLLRP